MLRDCHSLTLDMFNWVKTSDNWESLAAFTEESDGGLPNHGSGRSQTSF